MNIPNILGPNLNLNSVLAQAEKTQSNLVAIAADRQNKAQILDDDIASLQTTQKELVAEGDRASRIAKKFKDLLT